MPKNTRKQNTPRTISTAIQEDFRRRHAAARDASSVRSAQRSVEVRRIAAAANTSGVSYGRLRSQGAGRNRGR